VGKRAAFVVRAVRRFRGGVGLFGVTWYRKVGDSGNAPRSVICKREVTVEVKMQGYGNGKVTDLGGRGVASTAGEDGAEARSVRNCAGEGGGQ